MPENTAQHHVLVIDDDPDIRPLVERALTGVAGALVFTTDPTKAVVLARERKPDLVLCDISMPVMDGYSVVRALQSESATAQVPVAFLTASREPLDRVRAFRFGVVAYLTKPFDPANLAREVRELLDDLPKRSGSTRARAAEADALVAEVRRSARSGVLHVRDDSGERTLAVRAGHIPAALPASHSAGAARLAEFRELDPRREEIVAAQPGEPNQHVPGFDSLPVALRRVLLVDADAVFRRALAGALQAHGLETREAGDGAQALREALDWRPALIATDIDMPGVTGFEFCRQVRRHSLLRQIPLVFLSGWDDLKTRVQGLTLGAEDFIGKQAPSHELLFRLQVILRRHVWNDGDSGGLAGDLGLLGAPGALQVPHLGRLSGTLLAHDGAAQVQVHYHQGQIVAAQSSSGLVDSEAVYAFIRWERGSFHFTPGQPEGALSGLGQSFDQLLLEGCRRLDEERR